MIITITLNAALDRTQRIEHPLQVGKLNRAVSSHLEPGGKGINVSRAIKALGGSSIALGFSAGTNGRIMKDMLTAADIHRRTGRAAAGGTEVRAGLCKAEHLRAG